jgi:hypothetical protein
LPNLIKNLKIKTTQKRFLKKCRYCNFKKKSCFINPSSCPALSSNCFRCYKQGHFLQSICCKIKKESLKNNHDSKEIKNGFEITEKRLFCRNCFKNHFHFPKFYRWTRTCKAKNLGPSAKHSTIAEETARLINQWITFLSRTRASTNLPHLCFENIELNKCLKLKGGSKI